MQVRTEHLIAYREGRIGDVPDEAFAAVVESEAYNDEPKPDRKLVERRLKALGVSIFDEARREPAPAPAETAPEVTIHFPRLKLMTEPKAGIASATKDGE